MNTKILILGLLIIATMVSGCTSSIYGTYIHEDNPNECLIIRENNVYTVRQEDGFGGSYLIDGDVLCLNTWFGNLEMTRCDGGWIDPDGERWIKK